MVDGQVQLSGHDLLDGLPRGRPDQVRAYFHLLGDRQIAETATNYRVHWLTSDANGRHRTSALAAHLYHRITDYCIPRSRLEDARREDARDGGSVQMMRLQEEARRLFLDSNTSGEGGELLLFFLLEAELGLPQILSKMALKTSSDMPIHGVDGVHAGVDDSGQLSVYWGESKLYQDFHSALTNCFDSIAPFLLDDGSGPAHRDLVLVRDHLDLGEREATLELVKYFTDDRPERLGIEVRGACLVGFSYDDFAVPFEADGSTVLAAVHAQIDGWAKSVKSRIANRNIANFTIEFFCLPLPSIVELRDEFQRLLGHAI